MSSTREVLKRAQMFGSSFDLPERGVAIVGLRNRIADDSKEATLRLIARLRSEGYDTGNVLTLGDFSKTDSLSVLVPPIALWPLPHDQRVGLMCGDLFLACVFHEDVWRNAFSAFGLSLSTEDDCWIVRVAGAPVRFDPLEKAKLRVGVAFGGISPRGVAEAVSTVMKSAPEA